MSSRMIFVTPSRKIDRVLGEKGRDFRKTLKLHDIFFVYMILIFICTHQLVRTPLLVKLLVFYYRMSFNNLTLRRDTSRIHFTQIISY